MSVWPELFTAEGNFASVVPLTMEHHDDLVEAASDGELHRLWYTKVPEPENIGAEIERRLGLRIVGSMLPFAIIERASGKAVGMTTYINIDAGNRRLEIGATWCRQSLQRSPIRSCPFERCSSTVPKPLASAPSTAL
jgi:RimJ/RimL family protein N-acetyltransferase